MNIPTLETIFDRRINGKLEEFQQEMNGYDLTVNRSTCGRFSDRENLYLFDMHTEPCPVAGNKQLIESLKAAGYVVAKFKKIGKRRDCYVFEVIKPAAVTAVGGSELVDEARAAESGSTAGGKHDC